MAGGASRDRAGAVGGYYKKASGRRSLTWSQVVDEALCFGWIDGKTQRIDEHRYRQRLTPRGKAATGATSTSPKWPNCAPRDA